MKTTKFLAKKEIAKDTWSFDFEKPADLNFIPGQYATWLLKCENGTLFEHYFSFASHPTDSHLTLATRDTKSLYKKSLLAMNPGDEIKISDPMGKFVLDKTNSPLVFLVGGIGITPVRSMLLELQKQNFPRKTFLFFGNRTQADAPFYDKLSQIQHKNYQFIPVHSQEPDFTGDQGYITEEIIKKYVTEPNLVRCYIVGPPKMVGAMHQLAKNIFEEDKIIFEEFSGYN